MRNVDVGIVLPLYQFGPERLTPRWVDIKRIAVRADELGFDTIWTIDELLWRSPGAVQQGMWDGVSMTGAVASATSRAKVGTWVLSALHRNPGIIAKTAETLDEISGGRFVFGLGAGHAGPGQAHAFGLPEDKVVGRFEEALNIIVPLMRTGHADFEGTFHAAHDLDQVPQGPRPGKIPLFIGGHGPRATRLAVRHADIWSAYVDERAHVDEIRPRIEQLEAICAEEGRDPASIGRSIGVPVNPTLPAGARPDTVSGSASEIADTLRSFLDVGYTQVELMLSPGTLEASEALGPVVELVKA
jgi:alkanesulfonate monooxygenase SsuD/methylene tetrahydromethanopterin reductase-like flavin-dependent oxidoreductase (luciferase family)